MAFEEYPKVVNVGGVNFTARDKAHEDALLAGKADPQVVEAEQARRDAEAAEAQRVADEAARKAKEAAQAAKDNAKAAKAAPKRKAKKTAKAKTSRKK